MAATQVDRDVRGPALTPVLVLARLLEIRVDQPKYHRCATSPPSSPATGTGSPAVADRSSNRGPTGVRPGPRSPSWSRCSRGAVRSPTTRSRPTILERRGRDRRVRQAAGPRHRPRRLGLIAGSGAPKKWGHRWGGQGGAWGGAEAKPRSRPRCRRPRPRRRLVRATADDVLRRSRVRWPVRRGRRRRAPRDGGLEFHDLLVLARDLLRTSASPATAARALHPLLLDEFQDTDPIQIELAILIAASAGRAARTAWHELAVDEGRLFFVGDPKQSIYRFRRADIGLFLEARDRFAGESRAHSPPTSGPSSPSSTGSTTCSAESMADEIPGAQPKYEPLSSQREPDLGRPPTGAARRTARRRRRSRAGPLREPKPPTWPTSSPTSVARPDQWPVRARRRRGARPGSPTSPSWCRPAPRSRASMEALEAEDIPYRAETGHARLRHPGGARSRSRCCGPSTTPATRSAWSPRCARRSTPARMSICSPSARRGALGHRARRPESVADDHPVRPRSAFLHSLWDQRWWLAPPRCSNDSCVSERARRSRLALGDRGPRGLAPAALPGRSGRAFEEADGGDLRAFVDWAELQGSDSARCTSRSLPETDDEAVQILTIHGAKGLEFPITILSGMTTRPGVRRGRFLVWDGDDREVSTRRASPPPLEPRSDLELEMDQHEKLRLLYVACTRARDICSSPRIMWRTSPPSLR